MMKDKYQKQKLLQYFLSKDWYPQLEVDVVYNGGTSAKPKLITDIDVLAMAIGQNGILSVVIGDCKTLKNQSPINRAFWIKGVMSLFHSSIGIVLLSKDIEGEHKLLANDIGVDLLSENDFKIYSTATGSPNSVATSAIVNFDSWDKYFDLPNRFPNLQLLYTYCRSGYWNEIDFGVKLRHCIGRLRHVRQELNPDNNMAMFLFLELASLFSISINELAIKIFNKFLWPKDKETLDRELKILLWGGYENYTFWNELRNRLVSSSQNESTDLSLPEWSTFVNLIRTCLERPLSTSATPLILKELAFTFLSDQLVIDGNYNYLEVLVRRDPDAARSAVMIIDYLVKCARLPSEFSSVTTSTLMKLQRS